MLKLIANLQILHKIYSKLVIFFPIFLIHNNAKYITIKKVFFNLWIDGIKGDCIEFGIFTGSSFRHTINVENKLNKHSDTNFYGLDSFEGFPNSSHPFFKKTDFIANENKVKKIERINKGKVHIIKGFFDESLKTETLNNVKKLKFVHLDCDLYVSSIEPFRYIKSRLVNGAYLMIDDFTNIDREGKSIREAFYKEFNNHDFELIGYFGVDGVVIRFFSEK
tara:strand:+ start:1442 stop:2104 length:663 start_codon:yes stop_codon:yes gene_type:complete